MFDKLTIPTLILIGTLVWAVPIAVISIDQRISTKEKGFWICSVLILSWAAVVMYTFLAPIEKSSPKD